MTTTALTTPKRLTPDVWQMIQNVAPAMHQSRLFGVSSTEQAAAIMLRGYELGLPLAASFDFINVIQGKPSLNPRGALAIAQNSGQMEAFKVEDLTDPQGNPTRCRITGRRVGGHDYTIEVSMDDARRAGLVKPGSGWESWPGNMLRWRAIGFWLDVVMPDVIGGMKRADEYGADITPDGEIIENKTTLFQIAPRYQEPSTIEALIERYGVECVVEANGGTLPETQKDIDAVALLLED